MVFTVIKEGLRMAKRARRVKKSGFTPYDGTIKEMCEQIVEDTFDKKRKYFRVSANQGHFTEFYIRDFALCCEALQALGQETKVHETIEYAITAFMKSKKVTTAINPEGEPFDYFLPCGPDTFAFLLYSITHTNNHDLAAKHKEFLQLEANNFAQRFVDKDTLLMKKGLHASSIRDQTRRDRSCYDSVMIAVVARECKALNIEFTYIYEDIQQMIIKEYWNGTYFFQDMKKQAIVVGDANVFPFWCGIIDTKSPQGKAMLEQSMDAIRAAELDRPFPLRYVNTHDKKIEKTSFHFASIFSSDYETDSIWMHLGLAYLRVLQEHDKDLARMHLAAYEKNIKEHKTFLELYDKDAKPFRRHFYITDEAMLWTANMLLLRKQLGDNEKQ